MKSDVFVTHFNKDFMIKGDFGGFYMGSVIKKILSEVKSKFNELVGRVELEV